MTVTHYEKGMAFKNLRSNLGTKLKPPSPNIKVYNHDYDYYRDQKIGGLIELEMECYEEGWFESREARPRRRGRLVGEHARQGTNQGNDREAGISVADMRNTRSCWHETEQTLNLDGRERGPSEPKQAL